MLVFAYDGSLNGDWVAHYAIRFASHAPARRLRLVHVHAGATAPHLEERIARIAEECRVLGVGLDVELDPGARDGVVARLLARCPLGADTTLVCGARARPRDRALLAGTVSARLLAVARTRVVALRVVHPGVLGQPGRVLLPVAGHPRGAADAVHLLRLLGPDLRQLVVLFVRERSRLRSHDPEPAALARLLAEGRAFVARVEDEARAGLSPHRFGIDAHALLARDAVREIVAATLRHRARLVVLGASERTLPERLVRGDPIERLLRESPADVAVHRGPR